MEILLIEVEHVLWCGVRGGEARQRPYRHLQAFLCHLQRGRSELPPKSPKWSFDGFDLSRNGHNPTNPIFDAIKTWCYSCDSERC